MTIRWKWSRCIPSASATIALITSAWLDTTQIAPSPCCSVSWRSQSRIAATPRACMSRIDSPPGNVTPLGCACTTFQSDSLARVLSGWPVQSPYPHSVSRSSVCTAYRVFQRRGDSVGGLDASLERARHHRGDGQLGDAGRSLGRLCQACIVEAHAGRSASEDPLGIRRRSAVPHEENSRHAFTLDGENVHGDRRLRRLQRGPTRPPGGDATDLDSALAALKQPTDFVWIGMFRPSEEEMDDVAKKLTLHPLAVEDAVRAHQRPKLERYDGDLLFMVLKTLWYVDAHDEVETGEIAIFVGTNYVVTVRHGEGGALQDTRGRIEQSAEVLGHGPFAVLWAVCDAVVDNYERVAADLENDVQEVELEVFAATRGDQSQRIYHLKREVAEFRRAVMPLREPLLRFAQRQVPGVPDDATAFFRDVADHAIRVTEQVEALDSLLSSAHDAHMARISVQQNDDMRKISAWVAIAAVPTLIAGIYGMNFDHMPELHWQLRLSDGDRPDGPGLPRRCSACSRSPAGSSPVAKRHSWLRETPLVVARNATRGCAKRQ